VCCEFEIITYSAALREKGKMMDNNCPLKPAAFMPQPFGQIAVEWRKHLLIAGSVVELSESPTMVVGWR
jgi:hypothetical protein